MNDTPDEDDLDESPAPTWWRRWGVGILKALGAVVAGLLLMQVVGWVRAPALPDKAPDFALRDLDGEVVRLSDHEGQTVVLNFWATWCGPCRVEAPAFSRFAEANPDIPVLGIAADGPAPRLRRAAEDIGITYRVLQGDGPTLKAYNIQSFPTTVVVGKDGEVVTAHVGIMLDPQINLATWGG